MGAANRPPNIKGGVYMGYGSVKTKIGDLEDMSILSTEICVPYEFVYERKPGEEDRKFIDEHRSKILEALSYAIANIEGIYRIEWDARNLKCKCINEDKAHYKNYIIVNRYVKKEELEV